jgi:hypothetical protein
MVKKNQYEVKDGLFLARLQIVASRDLHLSEAKRARKSKRFHLAKAHADFAAGVDWYITNVFDVVYGEEGKLIIKEGKQLTPLRGRKK